jgi:nicotinate-nucleotide adenylyltransferase
MTLDDRLSSARKIIGYRRIIAVDYEKHFNKFYTINLLKRLHAMYSAAEFFWIMGADNMASFHKWFRWRDIMKYATPAIFDRSYYHKAIKSYTMVKNFPDGLIVTSYCGDEMPDWLFFKIKKKNISSTQIRHETGIE